MAQQKVEYLKTVRVRKGNIVAWICYTNEFAKALLKDLADRSPETDKSFFKLINESEEHRNVWVVRIPEKVFDDCYAGRKSDIHLANKVVQLDFRNPPLNLNLLRKCFEGNKQIILEFNSWFAQNQDLFKNNNAIANEIRDAVLETGEDKNSIEFFKDPEVIVKILCQNIEKLKQHWQNEIHFYIFSSEKKAIDTVHTILKQNPVDKKFLFTNQNNTDTPNSLEFWYTDPETVRQDFLKPNKKTGCKLNQSESENISNSSSFSSSSSSSSSSSTSASSLAASALAAANHASPTALATTTRGSSESTQFNQFQLDYIEKHLAKHRQNSKDTRDFSSTSSSSSSLSSTSAPSSTASLSPGVNHSCPTDASTPQNSSSAPATTQTFLEASEYDEEIPENYCCPITQDIMTDPVIIKNGHTFERKDITEWLSINRNCPITRDPINSDDPIIPNRVLKSEIDAWKERHKSKKSESTSSTSSHINPTTTLPQANNSYPSSLSNYTNYTGASGPGNSEYNLWASSSPQPQPNPPQNNHYSQPHSSFGHRN